MLDFNDVTFYAQRGRRITEIVKADLSYCSPIMENKFEGCPSKTVTSNYLVAVASIRGHEGHMYVAFSPDLANKVKIGEKLPNGTYKVSKWQHANDKPKVVIEELPEE